MAGRLGEILVRKGYLGEKALEEILARRTGRLGECLLNSGLVTVPQLGEGLAEQFDVEYRKLTAQSLKPQVVQLIPEEFSREHLCVPLDVDREQLILAMECPDDIETISEVELMDALS